MVVKVIRLIYRYHVVFLFVLLEILTLSMVVTYNNYQRAVFFDSGNFISGNLFEQFSTFSQIFEFKQVNTKLAEENAVLRTALQELLLKSSRGTYHASDSIYLPRIAKDSSQKAVYRFTTARVINNSVNHSRKIGRQVLKYIERLERRTSVAGGHDVRPQVYARQQVTGQRVAVMTPSQGPEKL